jgi:NitT/TauT family transport system substrate-binding protein
MNRRAFLTGLAAAGGGQMFRAAPAAPAAEPPPETTTLRLIQVPSICRSPQYVAGPLLQGEGLTDVRYVKRPSSEHVPRTLAAGEVDISMGYVGPLIMAIDTGAPIVILAGGHVGCFELFGNDRVRSISDLKGKTVAAPSFGTSSQYTFVASMVTYVGLDPRKDVNWITLPQSEAMRRFEEGKIDAFIGFPPEPQELRARKIGHVVLNSSVDRPWSQYFCCLLAGNRDFVRKHPVATKRALRAILKAADLCVLDPEGAARTLVDKGFTARYDYALQAMKDIPYARWRDYDPEDTVRFYALRLHEAGLVKSSPKKIIAEGTDWRFFNELKRELKG